MFDLLTLTDLYELHADLFTDGMAVHESIMDPVTHEPLVPTFSPDWERAAKIHEAILDMMDRVAAEIDVRNARGEEFDGRQYGARTGA